MEDGGISVAPGPHDQLEQDYHQEDPDPNVGTQDDELDFGFETYVQAGPVPTGAVADDAPFVPDLKHGSAADDAHATTAGDEEARTGEYTEDPSVVAEFEAEYQDEIGYEDDDFVVTDVNIDLSVTKTGHVEAESSIAVPEGRVSSAQSVDGGHPEPSIHETDDSRYQDNTNFEDAPERSQPQDESGGVHEEDSVNHVGAENLNDHDANTEAAQEQYATHHQNMDLENALDALTRSFNEVPDIEVVYNEECYSLLGTPDDDPDSYFISDTRELDRPLSHFLATIRAVISDEIAPTDEVVVLFDPLGLEFGERSNVQFLSRSFREILDCHATLKNVSTASSMHGDPVVHLIVRRDSEEHFQELLTRTEFVKRGHSEADDSEISEDLEEDAEADGRDDGQMQDEPFGDAHSDEYREDGEHAASAAASDHAAGEHIDAGDEAHLQDELAGEQEQDLQPGASAPRSPTIPAEEFAGNEDLGGVSHDPRHANDGYEEEDEQAWDQGAEYEVAPLLDAEIALEVSGEPSHQPTEQQDGDDYADSEGLGAMDSTSPPENGGFEQEGGPNGDDLVLTLDDEAGLPTTRDDEDEAYEDYTITYDAADNVALDALTNEEPPVHETAHEITGEDSQDGGHVVATAETESVHTSTTLKGDEIDYEEQFPEDGPMTTANEALEQSAGASGTDNDEIDWENDEDEAEYEQQPASGGDDADSVEAQEEEAMTPPSAAGKRSRTDEAESHADETDYKRRRT